MADTVSHTQESSVGLVGSDHNPHPLLKDAALLDQTESQDPGEQVSQEILLQVPQFDRCPGAGQYPWAATNIPAEHLAAQRFMQGSLGLCLRDLSLVLPRGLYKE